MSSSATPSTRHLAAWNIRRVNLESATSGASTRTWNLMGTPANTADDTSTDNIVDTALDIISNGEWWHGWFENGATTQANIDAAVAKWAPGADFILIVVNSTLPGGLRTGNTLKVTTQETAAVIAHEFGHGFGDLADEYSASGKGNYTGGEPTPSEVNVTIETDRTKIKWRRYIAPGTPIPTGVGADAGYTAGTPPAGWDDQDDAGLFEGRAHLGDRHLPAGSQLPDAAQRGRFLPAVLHRDEGEAPQRDGAQVPDRGRRSLYELVAKRVLRDRRTRREPLSRQREPMGARPNHGRDHPGGWGIRAGDTYIAGDFDGDGRDELVAFNSTWWTIPLLGLIKVDTAGSLRLVRRYDADIPGWVVSPQTIASSSATSTVTGATTCS